MTTPEETDEFGKTLLSLPDEVLEKIFEIVVKTDDLLELTLVCKRFNEVISNSNILMCKVEVQWFDFEDKSFDDILDSTRKYQSVAVSESATNFPQFVNLHSSTLTEIFFHDVEITSSLFEDVLTSAADSLKIMNICDGRMTVDSVIEPIQLPKLKILELMYGGGDLYMPFLKFFHQSAITQFTYEENRYGNNEPVIGGEDFKTFLLSQTHLKQIHILGHITAYLLSDIDHVKSLKFQCKKLYLWLHNPLYGDPEIQQMILRNFQVLMQQQQPSLEVLTICGFTIDNVTAQIIFSMQLKDVRIVSCTFQPTVPVKFINNTVESMLLSQLRNITDDVEMFLSSILRSCNKIKELSFSTIKIGFEMSVAMAYGMPNLTSLSFYVCTLPLLTYPTIKKLSTTQCNGMCTMRFIRVNRQLEYVMVPKVLRGNPLFEEALVGTKITHVEYA